MEKTKLILRLLALVLVFCLMSVSAACGDDEEKTTSSSSSKPDYLTNDGVLEDDEDEDLLNDSDADIGIVSNNNSGSNGAGGGGGTTIIPSNTQDVDVDARQAFLDSVPSKYKGKNVKVMVWWEWHDWEADKFADFTKETGITIEPMIAGAPDGGNYYSKLNAYILQKSAPDLACLSSSYLPTVITQNYFQPLSVAKLDLTDSVFDTKTMDFYKYKNKYYGAIVKGTTVPVTLSVMYYNKDLLKKNGIKTPADYYNKGQWNWDSMIDIATQLQRKTGVKNQIAVDYGGYYIVLTAGEDVVKFNNGTITNNFKSQTLRNACKFYAELQTKYDLVTSGAYREFMSGSAGLCLGADYNAQKGGYFDQNIGDLFEWGVVPAPSPKGSKTYVPTAVKMYGIPRNAREPEAAGIVLRYWQDPNMNRPGSTTWSNDEVGDMMNHIWSLDKSCALSYGVMDYGTNSGMGGNFGQMFGKLGGASAGDINTILSQYSDVVDANIKRMQDDISGAGGGRIE